MLSDISDQVPDILQADVVIVGSGIAGVTIARKLAERKIKSIVVESGSEPFARHWQLAPADFKASNQRVGQDYIDLHVQRSFGGASNVWGGWCSSMRAVNFSRSDLPGYPGWPIARRDLNDYYRAAGETLALDDPGAIVDGQAELDGVANVVVAPFRESPPIRVPESWGGEIKASPYIHVILGLTAERFDADAGRVTALNARRDGDRPIKLVAGRYVIAGGACNNAMLLMRNAGRLAIPPESRSHIGVNFFEHPQIYDFGRVLLRPHIEEAITKSALSTNGNLSLAPPETYLTSNSLLDFYISLIPVDPAGWTDAERAMAANYQVIHGRQPRLFSSVLGMELAPDRSNRLVASDEGARYECTGMLQLDFGAGTARLAKAARSWFEGVAVESWFDETSDPAPVAVGHLMGMTRMAGRSADGVVDADCRVFGVENLHVAGSSVFPTTGCASPTLTLTALSLRLADLLSREIA